MTRTLSVLGALLVPLLPPLTGAGPQSAFRSLRSGSFVKLICGASNNDVALVRNLCFVYTLAGCDCIDVSLDEAVLLAAAEGIAAAITHAPDSTRPLLMVSVNDFDDLHFRKAQFDVRRCPADCPRPCERVCPAWAIPPLLADGSAAEQDHLGVLTQRCYGCGRCVPTCPLGLIETTSYTADRDAIRRVLSSGRAQALEIHTQAGSEQHFGALWKEIGMDVLRHANILAVSFPENGTNTIPYLESLQTIVSNSPGFAEFRGVQIWQTDGRPMSGDIGRGTARAACEMGLRVLEGGTHDDVFAVGKAGEQFVQLAGGTNDYSIVVAKELGLPGKAGFGGFAFGGFARKTIGKSLVSLEELSPGAKLEHHPEVLHSCLDFARRLISPIKALA